MISVAAAALIAGTGFANAQGTGTSREGASGGSTVQQSAPSAERGSAAAPTSRDATEPAKPSSGMKATEETKPSSGMKATQSEDKAAPGATKKMGAQDDLKAGAKPEKSAQDNVKGEQSKSMSSETAPNKNAATKDMKADSKTPTDTKAGTTNTESKTTGNAATSATAAPPAEKQTQIASAIRSEKIEETTNVNFELNVGARVPTSVRFYPLPPRIVEIYPEWRGYEVIRVHGRYVIVRPQTHEIVYIIEG
jgi:hypothetical protein